jgi:hypothetical protein
MGWITIRISVPIARLFGSGGLSVVENTGRLPVGLYAGSILCFSAGKRISSW